MCGWAVVQLDHDKEEHPWYAMSGTVLAELEVQITINRAELWAVTMPLAGLVGPSSIYTDGRGNIGCGNIDVDLWINSWALLTDCAEKEWDMDVKRVEGYRRKKVKLAMTKAQIFFERK